MSETGDNKPENMQEEVQSPPPRRGGNNNINRVPPKNVKTVGDEAKEKLNGSCADSSKSSYKSTRQQKPESPSNLASSDDEDDEQSEIPRVETPSKKSEIEVDNDLPDECPVCKLPTEACICNLNDEEDILEAIAQACPNITKRKKWERILRLALNGAKNNTSKNLRKKAYALIQAMEKNSTENEIDNSTASRTNRTDSEGCASLSACEIKDQELTSNVSKYRAMAHDLVVPDGFSMQEAVLYLSLYREICEAEIVPPKPKDNAFLIKEIKAGTSYDPKYSAFLSVRIELAIGKWGNKYKIETSTPGAEKPYMHVKYAYIIMMLIKYAFRPPKVKGIEDIDKLSTRRPIHVHLDQLAGCEAQNHNTGNPDNNKWIIPDLLAQRLIIQKFMTLYTPEQQEKLWNCPELDEDDCDTHTLQNFEKSLYGMLASYASERRNIVKHRWDLFERLPRQKYHDAFLLAQKYAKRADIIMGPEYIDELKRKLRFEEKTYDKFWDAVYDDNLTQPENQEVWIGKQATKLDNAIRQHRERKFKDKTAIGRAQLILKNRGSARPSSTYQRSMSRTRTATPSKEGMRKTYRRSRQTSRTSRASQPRDRSRNSSLKSLSKRTMSNRSSRYSSKTPNTDRKRKLSFGDVIDTKTIYNVGRVSGQGEKPTNASLAKKKEDKKKRDAQEKKKERMSQRDNRNGSRDSKHSRDRSKSRHSSRSSNRSAVSTGTNARDHRKDRERKTDAREQIVNAVTLGCGGFTPGDDYHSFPEDDSFVGDDEHSAYWEP